MIPDTSVSRTVIRSTVQAFQQWNRVCACYTALNVVWRGHQWRPQTAFEWYCAAEAVFFFVLVWYGAYIQKPAPHPPAMSPKEREILFNKTHSRIYDPVKFVRGWFHGADLADIGRAEIKRFLIWCFWDGRASDVDPDELERYTNKMESLVPGVKFREGDGRARSVCLTTDEFHIDFRALIWYAIVMLADTICYTVFTIWGYTYYHRSTTTLSSFPPRPLGLLSPSRSASERVSYWISRPHTSKTRLPVVFFHGIGIGLVMYLAFLRELDLALNEGAADDDQVGIVMVEMPQISSRISPIMRRADIVEELQKILDHHNIYRFVLCGHSYGSVLSTYVLTDPILSDRVSATLLVDPITILLHLPDVTYNFTRRPPERANEWGLWFFASIDPGVAHTLSRHNFWYEMCLWDDTIRDLVVNKNSRFTISLASDDLIINAETIGRHLAEEFASEDIPTHCSSGDAPEQPWTDAEPPLTTKTKSTATATTTEVTTNKWQQRPWVGEGVDVLWWPGFDHGIVFHESRARRGLIDVLTKYCEGS